jgi:hypothetical protein
MPRDTWLNALSVVKSIAINNIETKSFFMVVPSWIVKSAKSIPLLRALPSKNRDAVRPQKVYWRIGGPHVLQRPTAQCLLGSYGWVGRAKLNFLSFQKFIRILL